VTSEQREEIGKAARSVGLSLISGSLVDRTGEVLCPVRQPAQTLDALKRVLERGRAGDPNELAAAFQSINGPVDLRLSEDEQARLEVFRRFHRWSVRSAPVATYTRLIVGYYRSRGPYGVEGEEKCLRFLSDGERILFDFVEKSVSRPLEPEEKAYAIKQASTFPPQPPWREEVSLFIPPDAFPEPALAHGDVLRLALENPKVAATRLIRYPGGNPRAHAL
jgi:hypothetical protein